MAENNITINDKQYRVAPLRCKHLKQITNILKDGAVPLRAGLTSTLEVWSPFFLFSIRQYQPDFPESELEEMTLQEFLENWKIICEISGVKVNSVGEMNPTVASTGGVSMPGSVLPSDGHTLQ